MHFPLYKAKVSKHRVHIKKLLQEVQVLGQGEQRYVKGSEKYPI
jgi:hypothetical protein